MIITDEIDYFSLIFIMNVLYIHQLNQVSPFNSFHSNRIQSILLDLTAISSKSASLRPSSLYLQRRVPRSTSNPDLPSPSLSPEDELAMAAAAAANTSSMGSYSIYFLE